MHSKIGDDHDEADEDILSLCDLPINCKNKPPCQLLDQKIVPTKIESDEISSSPLKSSSPRGENQENLFEFFSEEWNVVDTSTSPRITISKPVIPFPPSQADDDDDDLVFRPKNVSFSKPPNPRTKNAGLPRVPLPHHKRSNSTRMPPSKPNQPIITKSKSYSSGTSKSVEDQSSKVSASPVKSKLLLVLFGLPPKIPTGQTMNDIKIRQSRRAPSTFFPSNTGNGCRDDQEAVTLGRRSENRMWRFMTCFRSQHREKLSFDV
ncbi:hypothetical protein POM88_048726 [Heracleum sosnowskyi]|uniref:Uncharacterized protein n=1 Tax=Heracleum sosnowskyi TaxID=360622 RepID=A0AAD8LYR4_9APIA|nr:hypothetical protein POM88_048726 [Heracleum sosnowskyi]